MNPYYEPEKLDLDMLSFDEPDLSYEYNTLCFWATKDGLIYTAQDSGCSCPTPFEDDHARDTREEVIATLERVGSVEQAEATFDAWNKERRSVWNESEPKTIFGSKERRELATWVSRRLKS